MKTLIARIFTLLFLTVIVPANADTWMQRFPAETPPSARAEHTAVWTGREMIVWGGTGPAMLSDGGRYNPAANRWTAVTTTGAPAGRRGHTAVWTGSEMIVWGGQSSFGNSRLNDGGRYNPVTDSWTAVSSTGAPAARYFQTAVWTGSEMIIWGGLAGNGRGFNDGGRYNPVTDSWAAISTTSAPPARAYHTAVWTGSEMIVWGGYNYTTSSVYLNSGGRFSPAGNNWTTVNAPGVPAPRYKHTAVWTGSEMIVWGGTPSIGGGGLNSGGRYNPAGNSWTAVTSNGAPAARFDHPAVWTGSEMIVWGGSNGSAALDSGARYNPAGESWAAVSTTGAPTERTVPAVWTGSEMLLWGGGNGTSYFDDTFSYHPDAEVFRITSAVIVGGNLLVSFPSVIGRNYTLWQSDTLAEGTWTDTGLTALTGTGDTLTFTVAAPTPGRRFFRVQSGP